MQTRTTPVPNYFFDVHLKTLKLAEIKVLLVINRQTLGWGDKRNTSGRKQIDWISGSQLRQKTGCSSRAITSAVDVLIKRQLIQVLGERGQILDTPEKRQGKIRLYYRLSSPVDNTRKSGLTSAFVAEDISKKYTSLLQNMQITVK